MFSKLRLDVLDRTARVDRDEAEFLRETPVFVYQPALVTLEGIEKIGSERKMHSGLPIIHSLSHYHARNKSLDVDIEIEDQIRHQRHPEQVAGPIRIGAHYAVAREGGVLVSVRDHVKARLDPRRNLLLATTGEVRSVGERERRYG